MKLITAFGRFWYDFVIGDDPKIAAGVVVALALVGAALAAGLGEHALTVLGGALLMLAFAVSLVIDVRPRKR